MVDEVRVEQHGAVREIVLDRPEAHNALSTAMARALVQACFDVADDRAARAVVLSSAAATAFCVGADLKERVGFSDHDLRMQRPVFRAAFGGVLELPLPTVAAVHGYALGGGTELALSCDLVVADETAVFGLPEVTVGLVPGGGGTQLALRRLGAGRAADLVLTGRRVEAAEAYRIGLVERLAPAGRAREVALEIAQGIARNSPVAVRAAKSALRRGLDTDLGSALDLEDEAWQAAAFSGDRREGIAAFVEKRDPVWPAPRP